MALLRKVAPVLLMSLAFVLAGCTDGGEAGGGAGPGNDAPPVKATSTTGGIRGVVVDERITPIKGALIEITGTNKNATTGEDGLFAVSGLDAGTYFLRASHPLYASMQQSVDVVAGDENPEAKRILLQRTVLIDPFLQTIQYEGFIVCSANLVVVLSEECGEGVGVEGMGRVGGQANNNVQFDFTIGPGVRTMVVEQVWEATSDAGRAFYSPISTGWSCEPVCDGNGITFMEGESPLLVHIDNATLDKEEVVPDETVISVFTWASRESTGVLLNQQFKTFVTTFHYLPAPEGWSFVAGDPDPFK